MNPTLKSIADHLVEKYTLTGGLSCIRFADASEGYSDGAIECYGTVPDSISNDTGWFFAGYLNDIMDEAFRV